jgi:hypothetical protein
MNRILFSILIILLTLTTKSQSIDVESEKFPGIKKLEVKSYNGCVKEGYRAVYLFDNKGQATESSNYFKKKLLAKYKYRYYEKGLLIEKIQTFDINNKNKIDTTKFIYEFDEQGRVISKSEFFGQWVVLENFQNFNNKGFPTRVIRTFDNKTTTIQKEYDTLGNESKIQKVENDTIITLEEKRFNTQGDISYSIIPDLVGKDKKGLAIYIGGNRFSAIEEYEYVYDNSNRWTEKYVVYEGKKLLIEKREYE